MQIDKRKRWAKKGNCLHCGVITGSRHNKYCKLAYKKLTINNIWNLIRKHIKS